jgi:1,5-anhydro-D-fructose reductase (1,5-anhydro-D-mannitol-forming)
VDGCRAAGVVLATNHGRRNEAPFRAARRLIAAGAIGRPLAVRSFSAVSLPERLRGWRLDNPAAGAGVVLDIVVHDADIIRYLLADEPLAVTALTAQQGLASGDVEDAVMGVLAMGGDVLAGFHCAFTVPYADTGAEVHGSEGSLLTRRGPSGAGSSLILRTADGEETPDLGEPVAAAEATVAAFQAAVSGDGRPSATGEDGLRALTVATATLESARTARTILIPPP